MGLAAKPKDQPTSSLSVDDLITHMRRCSLADVRLALIRLQTKDMEAYQQIVAFYRSVKLNLP